MSYQLIELKLENSMRVVTDAKPLYLTMGALSANDSTTLRVSVVVGTISGGTAALTLEESMDGGATWKAITTATDGPITGAGVYQVWLTDSSGVVAPNVRLKVLPSAGQYLYLTKAYRTFTTGDTIVPRSSGGGGGGGGGDVATETTLADIYTVVSDIGTSVEKLREWPYVTYDAMTYSWTVGTFTEVWTYKTGGAGGASVGTMTTVYTDATKATPVSVVFNPVKSV